MGLRGRRVVGLMCSVVGLALWLAPSAGAVVVRSASGHLYGINVRAGVNPAFIPGDTPVAHANGAASSPTGFSSNGNLDYNGGPVIHSSAPYVIFWDPTGTGIASGSRSLIQRFFVDSAHDSGLGTDVYAVNRQFYDGTGIVDYKQTFDPLTQVISDTQAFPARDTTNCVRIAATYPRCLTDAQLQAEITRLISADGLPTGIGPNAPIYFMVTPGDTNVCQDATTCADNVFCAYHGPYLDSGNIVLYSSIPMFPNGASANQNPKFCQFDNVSAVQEPNGDIADVALKYTSHEFNETLTDPLINAWFDTTSNAGGEDGDNCNFWGSTVDPKNGANPNAFLPAFGTSPGLYDQTMNANHYYTQTEWSNGDFNCEAQPTVQTLVPSFSDTAPAAAGQSVSFNPTTTVSSSGLTSAAWDWGDSTTSFTNASSGLTANHTFAAAGRYTVKLTAADAAGNVVSTTQPVLIGSPLVAAYTVSPNAPTVGSATSFDGRGSSDPNPGQGITAYSWSFGDGTGGTGATPQHTYARAGHYTVTLTVVDGIGLSGTVSHVITVGPAAHFKVTTRHPGTGERVGFDGSTTSDPGGRIVQYHWSFGDGSTGSGIKPTHVFRRRGNFTVTLTVTDVGGVQGSISMKVRIPLSGRIVSVSSKNGFLVIKLSGPGVLTLGGKHFRIRHAKTLKVKPPLTGGQLAKLRSTHVLKLTLRIKFVPSAGLSQSGTLHLTLHG